MQSSQEPSTGPRTGPLSHVRVLDLSRILAAPWAGQILADLGAEVIKVEKPGAGDDTRAWGPPFLKDAEGRDTREAGYYLAVNRGKRSITLSLDKPEGQRIVRELAMRADIVLENYKAGTLERYGLDAASLRKINPRLIYCSVTGFGQTGPYAPKPAYDFILQGLAGPMSTCGLPDDQPGGGPMRTAIPMTDMVTGLYATIGILGALMHRQKTGEGQAIDAAMLDATVAFNGHLAVGYLMSGKAPQRVGNTNPIASPSEVFDCADGRIIIAAGNNGQFQQLCAVLGAPDMSADPRFATNTDRVRHRDALVPLIEAETRKRSTAQWIALLEHRAVPCGPINTVAQAFEDAQVKARQLVVEQPLTAAATAQTGIASIASVASPLRLLDTPPVLHRAPPALGEHTDEVLAGLGQDVAAIAALREKGVV